MGTLSHFEILLGVTGGIAAYKTAALCSRLVQNGAGVTVVMTAHAERFVGKLTFSTLTGRHVYTDLFDNPDVMDSQHIRLTHDADLMVIAPATANIIAKAATGICDDMLSTVICSAESDVLFAPAMNIRMWHHPATVRNAATLKEMGYHLIGPESGALACGDVGPGRMSEPENILARIEELLSQLKPKRQQA
ncbi:MAG: hypothetical protein IID32_09835 [Planctomycetes bacterium]|nr:hypothetical protein [Planctomycetota bacterium]